MADNLQDFLRKAAEKRRQEAGQQPIEAVPADPPPIQSLAPKPTPLVEIVEAEPVPIQTVTESISPHVQEHLTPNVHAERVERLGDKIENSSLDPHLHEVFDHRVGHLSRKSVSDDAYEKDAADQAYQVTEIDHFDESAKKAPQQNLIAELFSSPKNIQQAFVFSEIIRPPHERWENDR